MNKSIFLAVGSLLLTVAVEAGQIVRRASLDIGSQSTKLVVADVDVDLQKVVGNEKKFEVKIDFKNTITNAADKRLDDKFLATALEELQKLKRNWEDEQASQVTAIATSSLRKAANGPDVAKLFHEKLGIAVKIIDQKEEATLGFYSALAKGLATAENLIAWDIGGDTTQVSALNPNGTFELYLGNVASVGFKNHIIQNIQDKSADVKTPNPLTLEDAEHAARDIGKVFDRGVSAPLKQKIVQPSSVVVGIGNVHGSSIANQLKKQSFTRQDLAKLLKVRAGLSDAQIESKNFADTEISNIAYVLGAMEALGIREVQIVGTNINYGTLVNPAYWTTR